MITKVPTFHNLTSNFNVFLSSHKHENITWRHQEMYLKDLFHSTIDIVFTRQFGMEYFHREGAAGNSVIQGLSIKVEKLRKIVN